WIPQDEDLRQELIDEFFELIGDDYESLVDTNRNVENIRNLLRILASISKRLDGSMILDYGAGTGLALKPAAEFNVQLIGIERSPVMSRRAIARGMTVWTPGELARQPRESLPNAFASYVFHLLPHTNGLRLLWSRLRPGSALAANF